jgi:integrase/recombinase XerD
MKDKGISYFLQSMKIDQGASVHTLSSYGRDLEQFLAMSDTPLTKRTEGDVQNFLKNLKKRQLKATSIARKISALKQFYQFAMKEEWIEEDPTLFIESPTAAKRLPKALDPSVIEALLEVTDKGLPYTGEVKEALRARDQAMIYLLYATGVRVSELIGIELSKVDLEAGLVRVMGKRSKERLVPFAKIAGEKVYDYLTHGRTLLKPKSEFLFLGERGHPLTRQAFWKILKKLAAQAGIRGALHPHMLRHTFATDLLRSGMNLRTLQLLLGHADLQTTEIYTHIAPETLKDVVERFHPRGGKSISKRKS